jgi:hypothetical protein
MHQDFSKTHQQLDGSAAKGCTSIAAKVPRQKEEAKGHESLSECPTCHAHLHATCNFCNQCGNVSQPTKIHAAPIKVYEPKGFVVRFPTCQHIPPEGLLLHWMCRT